MPVWLAPLLAFLEPLIQKFLPDKAKQDELKAQLQLAAAQADGAQLDADLKTALAQSAVNQVEAGSSSLFSSGWRPGMGWCCVASFAYNFIFRPLGQWIAQLINPHVAIPPQIDMALMMPVLLGMLGLGTMRTVERLNGVIPKGQ